MVSHDERSLVVKCRCGQVALEASGRPIVSTACYCASCQQAGRHLEALPSAPPILDEDGGTAFVLYRKDRVRCRHGAERLREHRLMPTSKTRRVVATCCNSAMFLEFTAGHWITLYADRLPPEDRPPTEMRVMTRDRRPGVAFADALPNHEKHSGKFMLRLIGAWARMRFRTPGIDFVSGPLDERPG